MNIQEARQILGVDADASLDDIRNAFRKKAAKTHPDVNKSADADSKFKKLNEAYILLQNPPEEPQVGFYNVDFFNVSFSDVFRNMHKNIIQVDVTFEESILGVQKKIKHTKVISCYECVGKIESSCKKCNGTKKIKNDIETILNIYPGINNNSILIRDSTHFKINILSHNDIIKINTVDVGSFLSISLLEALRGTSKKVITIKGEKTLKIPAKVKNMDKIEAAGLGVPPFGKHIFIVKVEYPEDVSELISCLENKDGYTNFGQS